MDNHVLLIIIAILGIALIVSIIVNVILYKELKHANWQLSWCRRLEP